MLALLSWHLDATEAHELQNTEFWAFAIGCYCEDFDVVFWNGSDSVAIYVGF